MLFYSKNLWPFLQRAKHKCEPASLPLASCPWCFLEVAVSLMATPNSLLITGKGGLLEVKTVLLSLGLYDSCVATAEPLLEGSICSEAIGKECEVSRSWLPAGGRRPVLHSFCLHSQTGRAAGFLVTKSTSSPRSLTRLSWDCSHPGSGTQAWWEGTQPSCAHSWQCHRRHLKTVCTVSKKRRDDPESQRAPEREHLLREHLNAISQARHYH